MNSIVTQPQPLH